MIKKTMWVMESDLDIKEIVAIVDEESNKIECYAYKDEYDDPEVKPDWIPTYDNEQYFDIEGQAVDARNQFVREMQDMIPRVKKFIDRMDNIDEDSKVFPHNKKDYLGVHIGRDDTYYRDKYWDEQSLCGYLVMAMRSGLMNINAETIRIDDVVRVEWGQYKDTDSDGDEINCDTATLILHGDKRLRTRKGVEYRLVEYIFGSNDSGHIFNVSKLSD